MSNRVLKQIFIGLIISIILFLIGYGIYYLATPKPSCFDNKKNQQEEGIDCGGPCLKPCLVVPYPQLLIKSKKAIAVGQLGYDLVIEIQNMNSNFGAKSFDYDIEITNTNNEIKTIKGNSYILAGSAEIKYLIKRGIQINGEINSINVKIKNIQWIELENAVNPELSILNKKIEYLNTVGKYAKVSGIIQNKSNLGFDVVEVETILFDRNKNIVGVGSTNLYTFDSNQMRYFEVTWPTQFLTEPVEILIKPQTNVLLNDNYLKIYGKKEKYQKY